MKIYRIIIVLILSLWLVSFIGCSDECDGENPTVTLVNNGTDKADIQIKTSGGNTENINNILPGNSSAPRSFAQGKIEFTITIQGVKDPIVYELDVYTCNNYEVKINEDNTVGSSGTPVSKRIL